MAVSLERVDDFPRPPVVLIVVMVKRYVIVESIRVFHCNGNIALGAT